MTRLPDFTGLLEDYLDDFEGITPLPETSREAIRAQIASTPQRAAWPPNDIARMALVAAAVVVIVLAGASFLARGNNVAGPVPGPAATPTAAPTATPTPSPSPTPAVSIGAGFLAYAQVSAPMPDGWHQEANFITLDEQSAKVGKLGLSAWTTDMVYGDPCHWRDTGVSLSPHPTVKEIANALADQVGRNASPPTRTTLGGWAATRIELEVPTDLELTTCDDLKYNAWSDTSDRSAPSGNWNHRKGQIDVVYVVDVDQSPVLIDVWHRPEATDVDLAELDALVSALTITLR
jgi:hypothetical protein